MKRIYSFISFAFTALTFFISALPAHADLCPTAASGFGPLCTLKLDNASTITGSIITLLLIFGIIVAVIFFIIGGIRWIMSGGDKGKLDSARHTVTGAIVGLVIAFSAYFILNVITFLFTKHTITNFTINPIVP